MKFVTTLVDSGRKTEDRRHRRRLLRAHQLKDRTVDERKHALKVSRERFRAL